MICFSDNVRQCNIAPSVVCVRLCFQFLFVCYYIAFVPARVAAN